MSPKTMKQWTVESTNGLDAMVFRTDAPVPSIGDNEVLVKFSAASLNYRDLVIPRGKYGFPLSLPVVPGSDGCGTVAATGRAVTRFRPGDRVLTIFNQAHISGAPTRAVLGSGLGGNVDGTLRGFGAFDEQGLVPAPRNLDAREAAVLTCAGVTAWNALFGLEGRAVREGDWVLCQGSGGVSVFALQFAKAAGAKVISTTSSKEKEEVLKKLGADFVINYRENPEWGKMAKEITGGQGVAHVIEVGGPKTMKQSLEAIKFEGVISVIGFLGGMSKDQPSFLETLARGCIVRGFLVGNRDHFEAMNAFIEKHDIHPVLDEKVFKLEDLKDAYQYMWEQKHFGKMVIAID